MRAVTQTDDGVVEVNFMWLPTWLGLNRVLLDELQKSLADKFVGEKVDEKLLDLMHHTVVEWFSARFPELNGLEDHLDSLKFITPP